MTIATSLLTISLVSCGGESERAATPPYKPHYSFALKYLMMPVAARTEGGEIPLEEGASIAHQRCVRVGEARLCIITDDRSILVRIINEGYDPVRIDWSRARFTYPDGTTRGVEVHPYGMSMPNDLRFPRRELVLAAREVANEEIWPRGKVYYAGSSRNAYIMYEPLIPLELHGDPEADVHWVDEFADEGRSLVLAIPVEQHGMQNVLEVEMKLVGRLKTEMEWAEKQGWQRDPNEN